MFVEILSTIFVSKNVMKVACEYWKF